MLQLLNYLVINFQTNLYYFNHSEDPTIPIQSFFSLFKKNRFFVFFFAIMLVSSHQSDLFIQIFVFLKGGLQVSRPFLQPDLSSSLIHPNQDCSRSPDTLFPLDFGHLPNQCLPLKPCCCLYSSPSPKVSFSLSLPGSSGADWLFCPITFVSYLIYYSLHVLSLLVYFSPSRLLILCTVLLLVYFVLVWFSILVYSTRHV